MLRVPEHVRQRAAHLPRRAQGAHVVPPVEHTTAPQPLPVETPCDPHAQPLHPARERRLVVSLAQEVQVVRQQRVVHDPEVGLRPRDERVHDRLVRRAAPQVLEALDEPQRHVQRLVPRERLARHMIHPSPRPGRLAPGSAPSAPQCGNSNDCCFPPPKAGLPLSDDQHRLPLHFPRGFSVRAERPMSRPWRAVP